MLNLRIGPLIINQLTSNNMVKNYFIILLYLLKSIDLDEVTLFSRSKSCMYSFEFKKRKSVIK